MAYSTLGRDSAHCKHRASKALKPKQQIRRAPAVQALPALPPCRSSLVFVRKRQGIFEFPYSCHGTAFSLFCHTGLFFYLSLRPISLFCHSGLRAGVQVNIDSLTAWIPGQARNDR